MFVRFVGATGSIVANDGGVLSVTRNGVGDYTVHLAQAISPREVDVSATASDGTARGFAIEHVSPTAVRIRFGGGSGGGQG